MTDSLLRRTATTVAEADEREHDIWAHVRRGLVYRRRTRCSPRSGRTRTALR